MRKSHGLSSPCDLLLPLSLLCFVASINRAFSVEEEREILLQFKGNVTDDPYGSLSSWVVNGDPCKAFKGVSCGSDGFVEKIALWNTSLTGQLSPSLSSLKRLRVLTLFGNSFRGEVPKVYGDLKSLWKINFSSNALSGTIPKFIGDLTNMRLLDLSGNGFVGEIPGELFDRCNKLKFVALSRNSLSGSIPESLKKCSELEGFDFSSNRLVGPIPIGLCRDIPRLDHVSLGGNDLSGSISSEFLSCNGLKVLDLGKNSFTGSAPFSVLGSRNISRFNVSFNRFTGEIPEITTCGEGLEIFDASGNSLEGEIPAGVSRCQGLKILNLGFNELRGEIPAELSRLERLLVVQLGNNSMIRGEIPKEIASIQLLQVLDLRNLNLIGEIPAEITNSIFLRGLDVSGNALEGKIPEALYNMTYLEILDLHRNRLTGTIPGTIGNLSRLRILDLSENSVSGPIPTSLGDLTALENLNLSYNNLSGTIPATLQRFGSSTFSGNPFLCGDPLPNSCAASDREKNEAKKKKKHLTVSAIVAIVAAAVILVGVCLVLIMNITAQRRKRRREEDGDRTIVEATPLRSSDSNVIIGKLVLFSKSLPSKYEDWESGTKALLDKECAIGAGSIGTVYRTTFEGSGISIAVKKLETLGRVRSQDEFEHEIGRLGSLRHPNLVALQGYYWSSSMQLILSEFVPNGNLYDKLHARNIADPDLDWSKRFTIALGTARAISFLHNDFCPPILHLDVKSSNVLLDENLECKLSDYGLGKLLPAMGYAVGYVAPELAQSSRLTSEKCDVYGFGVILLELVTGRKPVERSRFHEVVVLCEYVREVLERNSASDCFDGSLRGIVENELVQVMKLGLICTSELPSRRPNMAEVVQFLESVRNGSESDRHWNQSSTSGGGT